MTSQEMVKALSAMENLNTEAELINLNSALVSRLKTIRAREARVMKESLSVGDEVSWVGRKGSQRGHVKKIARKFATITTTNGQWRVPMNMLKKA
tara:strand:+ start:689 stop:973 length:285 start_codon:yes stop_codon:yes gene_type:complete